MKKIIVLLIWVFLLSLSSCSKDFIERPPESSATMDNLYKTDKDFRDALIGTYQALRNQYNNMWQFGDLRGDDAYIQISNQPNATAIDNFSINSSNTLLNSTWANYYIVINLTNNIITKIADIDVAVIPNKERYLAEAKFLRALAYFDLVRIFGDVPLILTVPTIDEVANTPRTPITTIYADVIVPDLQEAASNLPVVCTGTEVGRATNGAAKAILGRVYLTLHDFRNAELVLHELTEAPYAYALLPDYNALFDYTRDEHHSEYIFDIEYEEGLGGLGSPWTNGFMPNVPAMLEYYGIRGGFGESVSPTTSFVNLWQVGDKRKDVSVQCCGSWTNPSTGQVVVFNSSTIQSFTKKYITPVSTNNDSRANWKVVRYADVLLMLAEALNENGKTADAFPYLNLVRERAGLDALSNLSQSEVRDRIALERRFELSFEGHRWFDLLRTDKAYETMASTGMQPYMTVFPIPLTQLQVINNLNILGQNPGYD